MNGRGTPCGGPGESWRPRGGGPDRLGPPPWVCPVCREELASGKDGRRLACAGGHSFDVARQGYVNLLVAGQRRSHQPGDSAEMIGARRRFLASGAYDRVSDTLALVVQRLGTAAQDRAPAVAVTVVDVGCGEGRHTRRVAAALTSGSGGLEPVAVRLAGLDVAKPAVAAAAGADPTGWYAVASAGDLPLPTAGVDIALDVFGPVVASELARVVRPGGAVVAAHPGPAHLGALRALVYADARAHEVKDPLRAAREWFTRVGGVTVTFPVVFTDPGHLADLFAMTPYRWHAPPGITDRLALEAARPGGFTVEVDVVMTTYRRTQARAPDSTSTSPKQ